MHAPSILFPKGNTHGNTNAVAPQARYPSTCAPLGACLGQEAWPWSGYCLRKCTTLQTSRRNPACCSCRAANGRSRCKTRHLKQPNCPRCRRTITGFQVEHPTSCGSSHSSKPTLRMTRTAQNIVFSFPLSYVKVICTLL